MNKAVSWPPRCWLPARTWWAESCLRMTTTPGRSWSSSVLRIGRVFVRCPARHRLALRAHAGLLRQVLLRGRSPEPGGRIGAGRRDRRPVGSFAAGDHNAPHDAEGTSEACDGSVVKHGGVRVLESGGCPRGGVGAGGWLSPRSWPWMLPPISLVAAVAAGSSAVCPLRARERSSTQRGKVFGVGGPASTQDRANTRELRGSGTDWQSVLRGTCQRAAKWLNKTG